MSLILYRALVAPVLRVLIAVAAIGSDKARRGRVGRRQWRQQLASLGGRTGGEYRLHVHAASVGEFEQAKPIIEALRARGGSLTVTASFFSPSGYEQQGRYTGVDAACYLPNDTTSEMRAFLDIVDPDTIIIIRYDLWPGLLAEARRRSIPTVLACGVLHGNSSRFNPLLRPFFAWLYGQLSMIHAVGEDDRRAFARLVPEVPVVVSGDTRYDRVVDRARSVAAFNGFTARVIAGRTVLVAGSTWPPDEELLGAVGARDDMLLVIVPHEPTPQHVAALAAANPGAVLLSALEREPVARPRAIIVDRTGILSALYRVGSLAYVGGGFGAGVHSVLEPAAYGIPVLCGPRIDRSRDAKEMAGRGILAVVRTREEIAAVLERLLRDTVERERTGRAAAAFVAARAGAVAAILQSLAAAGYLPDALR